MSEEDIDECEHECEEEQPSFSLETDPQLRFTALYGEVNEQTACELIANLIVLKETGTSEQVVENPDNPEEKAVVQVHDDIDLYLSTYGGQAPEMMAVYDTIRMLREEHVIKITAVGKIMSAGILLLASGTKGHRKAGKHTRFMIHPPSGSSFGTSSELHNDRKEIRWIEKQLIDALEAETKMTRKKIISLFRRKTDTYFDVEQALEWGIIDSIF